MQFMQTTDGQQQRRDTAPCQPLAIVMLYSKETPLDIRPQVSYSIP